MIVEAQVTIKGSKAAIWSMITDIDNAAGTIGSIDEIEILERPASGFVGLKWRETRTMFGKTATEVMWITDASENDFYKARAESHGFIYISTLSLSEEAGANLLTMTHDSRPQGFVAKLLSVPMTLVFKGMAKKAFLKDLNDIRAAVEQDGGDRCT